MTKRVIAQIITREELIDAKALVSEVIFVCISLHSLAVSSLIAGDSFVHLPITSAQHSP